MESANRSSWSQLFEFLIGTTPIVGYFGLVLLVVYELPRTPLMYGTMADAALPGTLLVFGIHELGHHVTAEEYCGFREVYFSTFKSSLLPTLLTFFLSLSLVLVDTFGIIQIPLWAFLLGVVSPGGVVLKGGSRRASCSDEAALGGIILGAVPGMLLWLFTDIGFPSVSMTIATFALSFVMVLSLGLSAFNALPLPGLDGRKVVSMGELDTTFAMLVVMCVYVGMLVTLG